MPELVIGRRYLSYTAATWLLVAMIDNIARHRYPLVAMTGLLLGAILADAVNWEVLRRRRSRPEWKWTGETADGRRVTVEAKR